MSSQRDTVTLDDSVDDDLIDRALDSFYFTTESLEEKFRIKQRQYAAEHGEATIESELTSDTLVVTLSVGGESYPVEIPRTIDTTPVRRNAQEETTAEDLTLVAVSLMEGFPWTDECFLAMYTGKLVEPTSDYWDKHEPLFQSYHPPRGVYGKSQSKEQDEFLALPHLLNLDMATRHHSPPNPWTYAATAVVYEDTPLARVVLSRSEHWENESIETTVTYPERLRSV